MVIAVTLVRLRWREKVQEFYLVLEELDLLCDVLFETHRFSFIQVRVPHPHLCLFHGFQSPNDEEKV